MAVDSGCLALVGKVEYTTFSSMQPFIDSQWRPVRLCAKQSQGTKDDIKTIFWYLNDLGRG